MATRTPAEDRETFRAQARYVRTSARKARLVLEHIRGKGATEADAILRFSTRAVSRDAYKVLHSAVANAESNFGHDADELVVVAAYADEGPTLKRWRPRARGRVNRIEKRTCHITIKLAVAEPGEIKRRERRRGRVQAGASTQPETRGAAAAGTTAAATAAEPAAAEETAPETVTGPADAAPEAGPEGAAEPVAADEVAAELEGEELEAAPEAEASAEPEAAVADEPEAPVTERTEADAGETEPAADATPEGAAGGDENEREATD